MPNILILHIGYWNVEILIYNCSNNVKCKTVGYYNGNDFPNSLFITKNLIWLMLIILSQTNTRNGWNPICITFPRHVKSRFSLRVNYRSETKLTTNCHLVNEPKQARFWRIQIIRRKWLFIHYCFGDEKKANSFPR